VPGEAFIASSFNERQNMKINIVCVFWAAATLWLVGCARKADDMASAPPGFPLGTNAPPPNTRPGGDVPEIKLVRLFYATDRQRSGSPDPIEYYSGIRIPPTTEVEYGICDVTIPPNHQFARLEEYRWLRLEFKNVPEKHVTLTNVTPIARGDFFTRVRDTISGSAEKEIFVFIHGYNVTWEDSARRAGQIAYDVGLTPKRGVPFLYSWSSQGQTLEYLVDDNNIRTAALRLRGVLTNLVAQSGARRINILAHSMGNQALASALQLIGAGRPATPLFDQVLMAAPDVDLDFLIESAAEMRVTARHFTLYSCRKDKPLVISSWLRGRQGRVGSFAIIDGFDTLDTTRAQVDSFLNHSYVGDSQAVLRDVAKLLRYGCEVSKRCCCCFQSLPDAESGRNYWSFGETIPPTCTHTQECILAVAPVIPPP
jgi:esterase/lipase superfamily enzyme